MILNFAICILQNDKSIPVRNFIVLLQKKQEIMAEHTINKQKVNVRYLSVNQQDERWGLTVSTVGHQHILPNEPYPSPNHPFQYLFNTNKGRTLNEYQLVYIIDGSGVFESTNQKRIRITSGQMILLFPGEWHTYHPNPVTGWYEHWIGFNGNAIDALVRENFFGLRSPVFNVGFNEEIINLYHKAAECAMGQKAGFQQVLAGIVHMLLGYTYSQNRQSCFENMQLVSQIHEAKQLISKRYYTDLSAKAIADEVGLGYSNFRQKFKKYTGFSIMNYIEEMRIMKSKELLANTALTSKQIAYEVGFNTPYYFSIFFKRRTGYTPLEYRKIVRNEQQE